MKSSRVAFALCAVAGAAAPATASIFFTFEDQTGGREVAYHAPDQDPFGTMTYGEGFDPAPLLDFVLDASEEGGSVHHIPANLVWTNWQVGAITSAGSIISAEVSGEFDFIDRSGGATEGQSIISGSFSMGLVVQAIGAGSIVTSSAGGLDYVVGPAFSAREPHILDLVPWQDGTYTLTNITFSQFLSVTMGDQAYFADFTANAAFSGTADAVIPTPGAVGLALLGTAGMIRRRRR